MDPNDVIWRFATAWSGCDASPGYRTRCSSPEASSASATRCAVAFCLATRTSSVRNDRSSSQQSRDPGAAPAAVRCHARRSARSDQCAIFGEL